MEEQQMNIDDIFRQSGLGGRGFREAPPPAVWDKIAQKLDEGDERRKRRAIFWLRLPAAIVAVMLLSIGAWRVIVPGHNGQEAIADNGATKAVPALTHGYSTPAALVPLATLEESSALPAGKNAGNTATVVTEQARAQRTSAANKHSVASPIASASTENNRTALPTTAATGNPSLSQTSPSNPAVQLRSVASPALSATASGPRPERISATQLPVEQDRPAAVQPASPDAIQSAPLAAAMTGTQQRNTEAHAAARHERNITPALWPAHMAPVHASVWSRPVAALHDNLVAAAQFINAITSPVLEYDVILAKPRPAALPLLYSADSSAKSLARTPASLSFAGLAGIEPGTGGPLQYRISVAGQVMWHFPSSHWSIGLQPALRLGQLSNTMLSADQAYQRSVTEVNGKVMAAVSPSILGAMDTLYSYSIRQTFDSTVVQGRSVKGSIWEVELPLLLDYRTGAWHFWGGPSLNFGGRFMVSSGGEKTYTTVRRDSVVQSVPMPVAAFTNYFGAPSTLPQYSAATSNDVQQAADVRAGYLIGIGWQRGRWMLDASVHGQLSGYRQVAEPLRKVYEGPNVRLSVGYELFRAAMKKGKALSADK